MKSKTIIFSLVAAVFFIACQSAKVDNTALNANKTETNQNAGTGSTGGISNSSGNETSKPKTNPETTPDEKTDEKADFEGTSGIVDKRYEIKSAALLKEVRTARHGFYARVVFEFEGAEMPG